MKRIISALTLLILSLRVATAGLSTGPSGTNNISGTLFAPLDATNVVNGMSTYGLIDGIIYVPTNLINGLNYALTNLAVATNKTYDGGGHIVLQAGTHIITTAFFYTNEFPASLTIEGEGMSGANVVYTGPSTNVNNFRFMGTQEPSTDGNLLHLYVKGVQFGSIYDNTNWIMQVQGAGWAYFENCSWAAWTIATNNSTRGLALSEAEVATSFTNLGGLYLFPGDTGASVSLNHCYFKWLQNGVYDGTDHNLILDTYFSVIAKNGTSTAWPTNSLFRLGAAYIRDNTPAQIGQTLLLHCHWTRDNICILDNSQTTLRFKSVAWGRMESPSSYRYVATNGGGGFTFYSFNDAHNAPDASFGISGTSYAVSTTPPNFGTFGLSDGLAVGYQMLYPAFNYGFKVNSVGNSYTTGTNNFRALSQSVNLDQMSLVVSGAETPYNGTWVFKEQDQRFSDRVNWRTVWTNATTPGTNAIVYDPGAGITWGLYNITNDVDNVVYFSADTSIDPPPTSWDQNTGSQPTITVAANYKTFSVNPNGSVSALNITATGGGAAIGSSGGLSGYGNGITNIAGGNVSAPLTLANSLIVTNFATFAGGVVLRTNGLFPGNPSTLDRGGSALFWNSNGTVYLVTTAPFSATMATNKLAP